MAVQLHSLKNFRDASARGAARSAASASSKRDIVAMALLVFRELVMAADPATRYS